MSRDASLEHLTQRLREMGLARPGGKFCCPAHQDDKPSLSVNVGDKGSPVVHCHAGCEQRAVIEAIGYEYFYERGETTKRRLVTAYDYVDAKGALVYQSLRYEPKDFRVRRPDPANPHIADAWKWNIDGIEPLLYRLDKIQPQEGKKRWLVICEGETDVERLAKFGWPATTNHGGAGNWKPAHTRRVAALAPELVVIFEDNDDAGRKRTAHVASELMAAGVSSIRAITAADLGLTAKGADVSDWLNAGHTRDELLTIMKETPVYVAPKSPAKPKLETVGEAQRQIGKDTAWLVDRMLAVGDLSVLVAKTGVGKSTFSAQLAVCVAYGRSFLGRDVRQGLVVYLAFEGARSTMAQMVQLGHDPDDPRILMWRAEADTTDPVTWLEETLKDVTPALIIVDTLADLVRASRGASNAGYEELIGKLGGIYLWAQARGVHIQLNHHAGKGDRDGIDAAFGSIGNVTKPGTVLDYRPMNPKDESSPRVLKGTKHREGDKEKDLPPVVLDFSRETGLTVAGHREQVNVRELGVAIIRKVVANPNIRQSEVEAEVEGRKAAKLEALRLLTDETWGVLVKSGTAGSRTFPLRLAVRPDVAGDPVECWRRSASRFPSTPENRVGSQGPGTYSEHASIDENRVGSHRPSRYREPTQISSTTERVGSHVTTEVGQGVDPDDPANDLPVPDPDKILENWLASTASREPDSLPF